MDQRISFVTLAVADLERSRRFYVEGLGWEPELEVEGEVVMLAAGERLVLSLWDRAAFEAELGGRTVEGPGLLPFTLAHNVETPALVDEVLSLAAGAGARGRARRPTASGVATRATSPTRTASGGRSPGTRGRSACGWCRAPTPPPGVSGGAQRPAARRSGVCRA